MTPKRGTAVAVGGLLAAAIVGAMLLGWTPWAADDGLRLGAEDDGRRVEVAAGEQITLRLEGNPTTGWAWQVTAVDPAVLAPAGEPDYESSSDADGAGGTYTFRFEAVAAGETQLVLEYAPTWGAPEAVPQVFRVTVAVV
ncbi:MAG: inhibitor of cysteine peptidase [Acidobacteria bacterium]|nr:inhibitor of cysteine peptidase [Acidobacteriota bacterium]